MALAIAQRRTRLWAPAVEPKFKNWNGKGSLIDFIISKNLHRRHLSESQKGACARDALPFLREEAKNRQIAAQNNNRGRAVSEKIHEQENGRATEHAANLFGTNWRYVHDADKIAEENPEYFEKIKSGEITIPKAKEQIKVALQSRHFRLSSRAVTFGVDRRQRWFWHRARRQRQKRCWDPATVISALSLGSSQRRT